VFVRNEKRLNSKGPTYYLWLVLNRMDSEIISSNFNGWAYNYDNEVPGSVLDQSEICNGKEDYAIDNSTNHSKWEGWIIHPDGLLILHIDSVVRALKDGMRILIFV
jgi:hypothetical protein